MVFAAGALAEPAPTEVEQRCFESIQGKVPWNRAGVTTWAEANLRTLCRGTPDPAMTVACFKAEIESHDDWSRGIESCKGDKIPGFAERFARSGVTGSAIARTTG